MKRDGVAYNLGETQTCNNFFFYFSVARSSKACGKRRKTLKSWRGIYPSISSFLLCHGKAVNLLHLWKLEWRNVKFLYKMKKRNTTWLIRHCLTSLKLEQLTTKILKPNSNRHKRVELWAKSMKDFVNLGRHFPCATSAKILAVWTRVCRRRWRNLF